MSGVRNGCWCGVIVAVMGLAAAVQAQAIQTTPFRGTVVTASPDGTYFTISNGNTDNLTIKTAPATQYTLDRQPSTFEATVRVGEQLRGTVSPDGVAVQVMGFLSPADRIGQAIGSPPQEWQVLKPYVEAVLTAQDAVNALQPRQGRGRNMQVPTPPGTDGDIEADLRQQREKRAEAESKLATARAQLQQLVTVKQEWILVQLGVLE